MASPSDILGGMKNAVDEQSANLESSIGQVEELQDKYIEEIDGVENGLCGVANTDMTDYLDNIKLAEIEGLYGTPSNTPFTMDYGPNYGSINYAAGGLTDFSILDSTGNIMYAYLGVNWDSDPEITQWVGDFSFGNDYLTRPLTSGASYGLQDNLSNMTSAKNILDSNKSKIDSSKAIFERYS